MASRIYEYAKSVEQYNLTSSPRRDYDSATIIPIVAKGNIYQGITAQW